MDINARREVMDPLDMPSPSELASEEERPERPFTTSALMGAHLAREALLMDGAQAMALEQYGEGLRQALAYLLAFSDRYEVDFWTALSAAIAIAATPSIHAIDCDMGDDCACENRDD